MRRGIAIALFGIMIVSCGDADAERQVIDQDDSGSEVSVEVGDEVEVRLESNPTTGYGWVVTAQPEVIELVSNDFQAPDTDLVGAGASTSSCSRRRRRVQGSCDWSTCDPSTIHRSRPRSWSTSSRSAEP